MLAGVGFEVPVTESATIVRGGDDDLPCSRPDHCVDPGRMVPQADDFLPGLDIPNLELFVGSGAHQLRGIRVESDTQNRSGVTFQAGGFLRRSADR